MELNGHIQVLAALTPERTLGTDTFERRVDWRVDLNTVPWQGIEQVLLYERNTMTLLQLLMKSTTTWETQA
jgi:hypothetical protein